MKKWIVLVVGAWGFLTYSGYAEDVAMVANISDVSGYFLDYRVMPKKQKTQTPACAVSLGLIIGPKERKAALLRKSVSSHIRFAYFRSPLHISFSKEVAVPDMPHGLSLSYMPRFGKTLLGYTVLRNTAAFRLIQIIRQRAKAVEDTGIDAIFKAKRIFFSA